MESTTIITTCKGRLPSLVTSLEGWLRASDARVIVVSDGCPELEVHPMPLVAGDDARVSVFYTPADIGDHFSKPRALNLGAHAARAWTTAEHLLFLDADTLMNTPFWPWYVARREPGVMFMAEPSSERRDLTGVLGVTASDFEAAGGADEGFAGWGSEDLDLRLRIYLTRKPQILTIPPDHLDSIPHNDELRTLHYAEKNKMASHQQNLRRLTQNAERVSGQSIWSLLELDTVRLLLGAGFPREAQSGAPEP